MFLSQFLADLGSIGDQFSFSSHFLQQLMSLLESFFPSSLIESKSSTYLLISMSLFFRFHSFTKRTTMFLMLLTLKLFSHWARCLISPTLSSPAVWQQLQLINQSPIFYISYSLLCLIGHFLIFFASLSTRALRFKTIFFYLF